MPARQARPSATARRFSFSTEQLYDGVKRLKELQCYKGDPFFNDVTFVTFLTSLIICAMLDIRLIREKPDFVRARLATRGGGDEVKIDEVLGADAERRKLETVLQQLNADRNRLSKDIGKKLARGEAADELQERVREIGDQIASLNAQAAAAEAEQNNLLLQIANLPHESVPIGKDPSANRVVRNWGEKPLLTNPVDHVALGTRLNLFSPEWAT